MRADMSIVWLFTSTAGWTDCRRYIALEWNGAFTFDHLIIQDAKWNRSLVVVRVVGAAPDALLADHLYESIRQELGQVTKDPTTTADGHWTERIGCQLAKDTRLTILLAGVDRLDLWGLISVDKLPENVRLIVTCSNLPKDARGWAVRSLHNGPMPTPVSWSSDPVLAPLMSSGKTTDAILNEFFDETERRFPVEFVRKACAALNLASGVAGRNSSGLTEEELRQCLQHLSTGDSLQKHLPQLIQSLGISLSIFPSYSTRV